MAYQKLWSSEKDLKLRQLILDHHEYDWAMLASYLSVDISEVKARWQDHIYPTLRSDRKIAGAFIWTPDEDRIIQFAGALSYNKLQSLLEFLPSRTHFSLQARWKRIHLKNPHDKKKAITNTFQTDLRMRNHLKRLKQYEQILNMRQGSLAKSESEVSKIVETGENQLGQHQDY